MPKNTTGANAMLYHSLPQPGKISVTPTKPLMTQRDLSLAYTPGVAEVCTAIKKHPEQAYNLTAKGNLVAVITNGTAVLGLGNIGPLASKPVMEGKSVLFKKFANIDAFDLEIDETDVDAFVDTVARLAPTFGGINLEDIKAPECFEIEKKLVERLDIPVMHDDQHGTAIIVTAAFMNALHINGKDKKKIKLVCVGAGAAGLACVRMLHDYGVPKKNITIVDLDGVVYHERPQMNPYIEEFATTGKARTLADAVKGADVFLGLSAGGVLTPEMVKTMNPDPVIFAMANPDPEIMPDVARAAAPGAIIGTGRSDFPNQINNVLGFPYLFRGALDVGAKTINMEMKLAAAEALANLARMEADAELDKSYKGQKLTFGPEYIIPKPFDPRLLPAIAGAVARAATASGVATRPLADEKQYLQTLTETIDHSFGLMRQIFNLARRDERKIVYPEGEDPRVLRAAQILVSEGLGRPILIGRRDVVKATMRELGLRMKEGEHFELIQADEFEKLPEYAAEYYDLRKRHGILPPEAEIIIRSRWTALAAMMVRRGEADAMVAGVTGRFWKFFRATEQIIGHKPGVKGIYALQLVMHQGRVYFLVDTHVNPNPTAEQIAEMTKLTCDEVRFFGVEPKVAFLSHSHFGSSSHESAVKMRTARDMVLAQWPDIMADGEMQADAAMNMDIMRNTFPDSKLTEPANVLIMPSADAANITFNMLRALNSSGAGEYIGPILLGMNKPVHILSVSSSVRRIVNMSALAIVESQHLDSIAG